MTEGIYVEEQKYINQEISLVRVFFQLSAPDWNLLKMTPQWAQVEQLILENQKRYNQKYR